jgi:hypothetical protein
VEMVAIFLVLPLSTTPYDFPFFVLSSFSFSYLHFALTQLNLYPVTRNQNLGQITERPVPGLLFYLQVGAYMLTVRLPFHSSYVLGLLLSDIQIRRSWMGSRVRM